MRYAGRAVDIAAIAALVAGGVLVSLSGFSTHDEAWFLQVVTRVADGDVLYRDVFYGPTPLAVYAALPLVALFGAQIAWVKVVLIACFVASVVLVVAIARQLGGGRAASLVLGAAVLAWAPPSQVAAYQPLATVFLLACLCATLSWAERRTTTSLVLAGVAAGLAFGSKQNVGAYALAALLAAILVEGGRLRALGLALAGFLAAVVAVLVPVAVTGGWGKFVEYGVSNKGRYLELGNVSYLDGMRDQGAIVNAIWDVADRGLELTLYGLQAGFDLAAYGIVPLTLALLAAALVRGPDRRQIAVVGLFTLAAAAAIFPRADTIHVVFVMPVILVGAFCALRALLRGAPRAAVVAVGAALALALAPGLGARIASPLVQLERSHLELADVPQARGLLLPPGLDDVVNDTGARLRRERAAGPLFLATPEAGFYYLVSGIENPTPYDYPLATAFGKHGEDELIALVASGEIETVCLRLVGYGGLTPKRLVAYVTANLELVENIGPCDLYRQQR